jgi:hypothetical protein
MILYVFRESHGGNPKGGAQEEQVQQAHVISAPFLRLRHLVSQLTGASYRLFV